MAKAKPTQLRIQLLVRKDRLERIVSRRQPGKTNPRRELLIKRKEMAKKYLEELEKAFSILEEIDYEAMSVSSDYHEILGEMNVEIEDVFIGEYVKIRKMAKNDKYMVYTEPVRDIEEYVG